MKTSDEGEKQPRVVDLIETVTGKHAAFNEKPGIEQMVHLQMDKAYPPRNGMTS